MRYEDDVSIMISGRPDFGERKTRSEVRRVEVSDKQQTTNYSGNHEKAPVGRGGSDRAVVVQRQGRTRDSGTAPTGFAGTPLRGGRTSARAEETTARSWKRHGLEEIKELALERNISMTGPDGKPRSRRR